MLCSFLRGVCDPPEEASSLPNISSTVSDVTNGPLTAPVEARRSIVFTVEPLRLVSLPLVLLGDMKSDGLDIGDGCRSIKELGPSGDWVPLEQEGSVSV
jgi:hypothetical protein